ncbi:MAG: ABC transporter ATP-binding protein [Ornithinimicrobium sp.]
MSEPEAPVLALSHASFGYAGTPVVNSFSLTVHAGEVVALLGPNGSGKSTLVRGMLGLNDHLGGTVTLGGSAMGREADRRDVGYVPQRHTLSGTVCATAREVVATGRLAHRPWWRRAGSKDADLVQRALETVGLADRADADVSELSGGQQRRVLIARALAGEPAVLLMDEPMAGIDQASQEVLTRLLHRLVARGVTMLIVTHDLSMLHEVITRIVALEAGEIVFDGPHADYSAYLQEHPMALAHHHHPRRSSTWWAGPADHDRPVRHG